MHAEFRSAVDDFEIYNQGRNLSTKTIYWYTFQLHQFGEFLATRGQSLDKSQAWTLWLSGPMSERVVCTSAALIRAIVLCAFFDGLNDMDILMVLPIN
ncbi:MAG: hypothetical protein R3E79_23870 [Caldilineaceae bacterium]